MPQVYHPEQADLFDTSNFGLTGIDWVIVGGGSGNRARPVKPEWMI